MINEQHKAWIDASTYEELLRRWRYAECGDPIFQGASGNYYKARMTLLRDKDPQGAVKASKLVGWTV